MTQVDYQKVINDLALRIAQLEVNLAVAQSQIPTEQPTLDDVLETADALAREERDQALRDADLQEEGTDDEAV